MRIERLKNGTVDSFLEVKEPQGNTAIGTKIVIGKLQTIDNRSYILTEEIDLSSAELESLAKEFLKIISKSHRHRLLFPKGTP